MGLKIDHIDAERVTGTLDGSLPFRVSRSDNLITVNVAGWTHDLPPLGVDDMSEMRSAAYLGLARFREHQKHAVAAAA